MYFAQEQMEKLKDGNGNINMVKEMEYKTLRESKEIICNGHYRGYYFEIVSYGTHPCAYILIEDMNDFFYGKDYDNLSFINCHGGLTFSEFDDIDKNKWVIGWDYAHAGDWVGYKPTLGIKTHLIDDYIYDDWGDDYGKKYTVKVIVNDVFKVIDQMVSKNGDK